MPRGTVKRWLVSKGLGWITGTDGEDYYVHNSDIEGGSRLDEG
eukprot:gene806-13936_t